MWFSRWDLKARARGELRLYFWPALGATVIRSAIGRAGDSAASIPATIIAGVAVPLGTWGLRPILWDSAVDLLVVCINLAVLAVAGMLSAVLVSNPIDLGLKTWFLSASRGSLDFGALFCAFRRGRYWAAVKKMASITVAVWLWHLLLVIPGIVRQYQYFMTTYLISDYPHLSARQAKALSRDMTRGVKWWIFVLEVSFAGPVFLGLFFLFLVVGMHLPAAVIGLAGVLVALLLLVWVCCAGPYMQACFVQLYYLLLPQVSIPSPTARQSEVQKSEVKAAANCCKCET